MLMGWDGRLSAQCFFPGLTCYLGPAPPRMPRHSQAAEGHAGTHTWCGARLFLLLLWGGPGM